MSGLLALEAARGDGRGEHGAAAGWLEGAKGEDGGDVRVVLALAPAALAEGQVETLGDAALVLAGNEHVVPRQREPLSKMCTSVSGPIES